MLGRRWRREWRQKRRIRVHNTGISWRRWYYVAHVGPCLFLNHPSIAYCSALLEIPSCTISSYLDKKNEIQTSNRVVSHIQIYTDVRLFICNAASVCTMLSYVMPCRHAIDPFNPWQNGYLLRTAGGMV